MLEIKIEKFKSIYVLSKMTKISLLCVSINNIFIENNFNF